MNDVLKNHREILSKLSQKEAQTLILTLEVGEKIGRPAMRIARKLLRETPVDSPNFDKEIFMQKVKEVADKEPIADKEPDFESFNFIRPIGYDENDENNKIKEIKF
jgi:hypothetical protein